MIDDTWSMIPVGAPTASFSAVRPTFAWSIGARPRLHSSSNAAAAAPSIAADDDNPAPTGTSEAIAMSSPRGAGLPRSAAHATPSG